MFHFQNRRYTHTSWQCLSTDLSLKCLHVPLSESTPYTHLERLSLDGWPQTSVSGSSSHGDVRVQCPEDFQHPTCASELWGSSDPGVCPDNGNHPHILHWTYPCTRLHFESKSNAGQLCARTIYWSSDLWNFYPHSTTTSTTTAATTTTTNKQKAKISTHMDLTLKICFVPPSDPTPYTQL